MSTLDPQSKSGPLVTTGDEKLLNVGSRNSGDLFGIPDDYVVVLSNIGRQERIAGLTR